MKPQEIVDLHNLCKIIGQIKKQRIEQLSHYSSETLFFHNDEITSGLLDNKMEIKINLLAKKLVFTYNEENYFVNLYEPNVSDNLKKIVQKFDLSVPDIKIDSVGENQFLKFHSYAPLAVKTLELFRMNLQGQFSLVHLWPHHFDFSVEWFTGNSDEQIGTGISPGDENYEKPYLYINPWPFNEKITNSDLPMGQWHTSGWNGIKVEWEELQKLKPIDAAENLIALFKIAKRTFIEMKLLG